MAEARNSKSDIDHTVALVLRSEVAQDESARKDCPGNGRTMEAQCFYMLVFNPETCEFRRNFELG